jgi:glutathione S-transferase
LESELGKQENEFLVGKEYTLADVMATVFCARIYLKKEKDMFGPNLRKYWDKV